MIQPLDVHIEAAIVDIWERVSIHIAVPLLSAVRALQWSARLLFPLVYAGKVEVDTALRPTVDNVLNVRLKIFVADRAFDLELLSVTLKYFAKVS